jgi:copper chaperone CopZ
MENRIWVAMTLLVSLSVAALSPLPAQQTAPAKEPSAAEKPTLSKARFLITGLHCPPCTSTVERSLKSAKGVRSIKVDWSTKNALVEFDESVIPAQKVAKMIAGTPHMMGNDMRYTGWLALKVADVDKDEIAAKAKESLGKVKGVAKIAIYPKQGSVGIAFTDDGKVTIRDLLSALEAAGLKGSAIETSSRSTGGLADDGMAMDATGGQSEFENINDAFGTVLTPA